MTHTRKNTFLTALTLAALTVGAWAQTQTASNAGPENPAAKPAATPAAAPATPPPAVTAADVQSLKDAIAAQQLQIQRLTEQLERQQQLQEAQQSAINAEKAPAKPQQQVASVGSASVSTAPVTTSSINTAPVNASGMNAVAPVQQEVTPSQNPEDAPQTINQQMEGPLTLHFRGINITPGGYAAGEFVRRSRGLAADLSTPYNSVPMPGASQSDLPEFFGSGRQSKITTFVDGRLHGVDLSSYVSTDFLSAGVTSNSNQTNSYTLRLRQAWAQAKFNTGTSFLAGQAWSLVTENGTGIAPDDDLGRSNDARPKVIDPNYNVGFVFARQWGLRLTQTLGDKVTVAVAVENPQATLTSHGNASNFLVGETGASNSYNTTANYSFNPAPDLIAKVAFDPGIGHYEVFGLLDRFTDRVFPCVENFASPSCGSLTAASAVGAYNASKSGGGVGASARWNIVNRFTFGLKGVGGSGVGRYGPAGLPDVSVNGDGTLHLVKNFMGLGTFEVHLTKKLDFDSYFGFEYAGRAASFDPFLNKGAGGVVGYGAPTFNNSGCGTETVPGSGGFSPGSLAGCTADTRTIIEGQGGFWYKFYSGPRGSFRFGADYGYVSRFTWSGGGASPYGVDNMVFSSFRYYLP
jgi:hypothetical protein